MDNQLVGDTPLQDLDHVISYIRSYIKSDRTKLSFRFRRIDFPQREIAKMSPDNRKSNSTKKKVGRWLRKRLSSGSDKKKKESSKSPRSWKASLGGMWAKATEVASNASKNLRNMKSSDDDPASYGLVPFAEWKLDEKQKFFEAKNKDDATCYVTSSNGFVVVLQRSEMFEGWASVLLKFHVINLAKITSRKSVQSSVILHVKDEGSDGVSEHFFIVTEKKECVKSIRDEFYKAKHGG